MESVGRAGGRWAESGDAGTRLAWALWLVGAGLFVAGLVINVTSWAQNWWLPVVGVPFVTFGAFLAARRPHNPIGWLFGGWGTVMAAMAFATAYVQRGLVLQPGSLPGPPAGAGDLGLDAVDASGPDWVAWAGAVIWHPAFALLVFVLLLFPHGHLPSPRWRPVAWLTVAVYGAMAVSSALSPSAAQGYFPAARPVLTVPGAEIATTVFERTLLPAQVGLLGVAGITALVVKLWRARGDERQQLKWFVFTVAVVVVTFVAGIFVLGDGRLFPVFGAIPAAAVLAICATACTTSTGSSTVRSYTPCSPRCWVWGTRS